MLEKECCELLKIKVNWAVNTPDSEATLTSLTYAIGRSIESRLVDFLTKIAEFTPVRMLDDGSLLLLKRGNDLMCLRSGYEHENFDTLRDGVTLLRALDSDGFLHEVLPQPIVDEYKRLSDIVMVDRITRSLENDRKRDRGHLERLMKKRENGLI